MLRQQKLKLKLIAQLDSRCQYFASVALGANFTPAPRYTAFFVDYESAALYATNFFAVHIFLDHYIEYRAQLFVSIGYQGYFQGMLGAKILVLAVAIARYAKQGDVVRSESFLQIAEFFVFNGAAWGVISRIEIQNPDLPQKFFRVDLGTIVGCYVKLWDSACCCVYHRC